MKQLKTLHGTINLPAFFPDATYGQVKCVSSSELENIGIDGVVVNAYHLLKHNIIGKLKKGIHSYMKLNKPIISDSGGFQVMSLIHNNPKLGEISNKGALFFLDTENERFSVSQTPKRKQGVCDGKKIMLTPEKCIDIQLKIGSDVIMCLDDCTHSSISLKEQKKSVDRTINWARRCKKEFDSKTRKLKKKPLLFAIVQGGTSKKLRKYCANNLMKIGFDGYSFGGFPIKNGKLLIGILKYVSSLLPKDKPKYAMGIGKPEDIVSCYLIGYNLFDCVIPTRDARHKRLFIFTSKPTKTNILKKKFEEINIKKKFFSRKLKYCDCELCLRYSIKELYEMFKRDYEQACRLASMHNLRFYSMLMEGLR
jgi:queuine tRNA-ribosyltransferase